MKGSNKMDETLKIIMDSGKDYIFKGNYEKLIEIICNNKMNVTSGKMGVVINGIVKLQDDIFINPVHISSIENCKEGSFRVGFC